MIRRPPRSTQSRSSAASDVYKRQVQDAISPELTESAGTWVVAPSLREAPDRAWGARLASTHPHRGPQSPTASSGHVGKNVGKDWVEGAVCSKPQTSHRSHTEARSNSNPCRSR